MVFKQGVPEMILEKIEIKNTSSLLSPCGRARSHAAPPQANVPNLPSNQSRRPDNTTTNSFKHRTLFAAQKQLKTGSECP